MNELKKRLEVARIAQNAGMGTVNSSQPCILRMHDLKRLFREEAFVSDLSAPSTHRLEHDRFLKIVQRLYRIEGSVALLKRDG
jgi:hypothetical protein